MAQLHLALHMAGQDNPDVWGPQVGLLRSRYWDDLISGYLHSLSPATVSHSSLGQMYQPAWYGDGQRYQLTDYMGVFGALGLYDQATGNRERLQTLRWIETTTAKGGPDKVVTRVAGALEKGSVSDAILYFMLFDPSAPPPPDPRPTQPLTFDALGLGRVLARTSWGTDATWFTYGLGWNTISHQHGDGNGFELYRHGEWLIKERTGYGDNIASSDYHSTLALENDPPSHNDGGYRTINWRRGSQWLYAPAGDGRIVARSFAPGFVYVLGDATGLYNSTYEQSTDILHASRSIVWLKPDRIVIYDRAVSRTAGRFKRFWLNTPTLAEVSGNLCTNGTPFTGAAIDSTVVLFPVDLDAPFTRLVYVAPTSAVTHLMTGLAPGSGYNLATQINGGNVEVTVTPGTSYRADSGGVLTLTPGS